MAFILKDRVKESTSTTGTGAISLGGSLATFDDFQTYMSNGDTTYYSIAHTTAGTDEWEVGIGTWNTGNTLTRTTVLAGSNGTSAVDLSAGDKDIFITYPADKAVFKNASGTVDGRDISADGIKLDGIESGATADQTNAEIRAAIEAATDSNVFTDADHTKLDGIESGATADQTKADIDALNIDADTLDSLNSTQFLRSDTQSVLSSTGGQTLTLRDNNGSGTAAAVWLEFEDSGSNRVGYVGMGSGSNGNIYLSSQSASPILHSGNGTAPRYHNGTTDYIMWHAGNDGSGSGLDADTLDGVQGSSFLRSDATDTFTSLSGTSLTLGNGVLLKESSDRADLLEIKSTTGGWGGLQITNTPEEGRWSFMTDGTTAGFYDDQNAHWHIKMVENSYTNLFHDNNEQLRTLSGGVGTTGLTVGDVDANPHNAGGLQVSNTNNEKIVLSGSATPYIRWQEGTTDRAYIQYSSGTNSLRFANQEADNFEFMTHDASGALNIRLMGSDTDIWGSVYADNSQRIGFLDEGGSWAYRITNDSLHEWMIGTTIEMSLSSSTLDMKGNVITEVEDIGLRDKLYHDGDTDTYLGFTDNTITLSTAGSSEITINSTGVRLGDTGNGYFQPVTGHYGSIQIDGGAHSGYEGYSIGGRVVFMHNNSTAAGIYDDVNNDWMIYTELNSYTAMYHNGNQKGYTYSSGFRVTGNLLATSNVYAYYSDERLKSKDGIIEDALGKINSLETFYYYENDLAKEHGYDNDKRQLGVSAQQVEAILPECVAPAPFDVETDNEGNEWSKSGEDYLTVDYPRLVPLLIKGIQEQQDQIEMLKNEVKDLKDAINQ
tara:strand:+ start:567 stop:3053 length:2487 start_codon:yes stop_codon:yes gene_type:complete